MASHNGDSDALREISGSSSASPTERYISEGRGSSSGEASIPRPGPSYGTIDRSPLAVPLESGPEYQSFQASSSVPDFLRGPGLDPQNPERTPRKPPTVRRASSKPYRGQEFSVDDDVSEYEEDNALRKASSRTPARPYGTLRRRLNPQSPVMQQVESGDEDQANNQDDRDDSGSPENNGGDDNGEEDEGSTSDAESFTLKDRQQAINQTHPFGIRIWKPALYKKFRSVQRTAEGDIHSAPGEGVNNLLFIVNLLWTILFGWWLALVALLGACACFLVGFMPDAAAYGKVFFGLSGYLVYPFGSFVRLQSDENYAEEDEGEGRSISEYEQWQSGDLEHGRLFFGPVGRRSLVGRRRNSLDSSGEYESLLGRPGRGQRSDSPTHKNKRRFFGRGEWTLGRAIFYSFFYLLVGPLMLVVSLTCWMLVFWIPMGRVMIILLHHLRRHPLAVSFHLDSTYTRSPTHPPSSILLCTYRAAGLKYWKYTVDGTNIFFINLLGVVVFSILDYWLLHRTLQIEAWVTNTGLIFMLALLSIIPLAYFIGQAVASISAQSSMGLGAAVNAFFSTVVEVYLYCVALTEGKARLVEGSIVGSIFAGILFLPGLSMCFGAIKRKTQRFNVKSAGVTSTMLLFATVAAFGPTLFYQIYGSHELYCHPCSSPRLPSDKDCRRCYFSELPSFKNKFFIQAVQPYSWFAATLLFLCYVIGLWFTLRTHAAVIWSTELDEKKVSPPQEPPGAPQKTHGAVNGRQPPQGHNTKGSVRDSQLYARILGQSLKQVGLSPKDDDEGLQQPKQQPASDGQASLPHVVPPKSNEPHSLNLRLPGLSEEQNEVFVRQVTEVAATAATFAARDASRHPRKASVTAHTSGPHGHKPVVGQPGSAPEDINEAAVFHEPHPPTGGHDAPNWSKLKSSVILLSATLLYAIIAEILVNTVDVVLESVDVDEKFLGITLFSLIPNTTEFLNAISFAMNGNIALSMEIGSAYALQVCLLQIPALVLFSAIHTRFYVDPSELLSHSFNLIFPQWDMITVILCVFLLSYVYGEGKSNYFKGSILLLTYLFVIMGFFLTRYNTMEANGVDRFDTLALGRGAVLLTSPGSKGM
ncbi:calcium/proton exchanger [Coccidioides immitis RS]|uniref:calcium/proton exchanger n=1 Tax=Coccidioides immitis (strain RS) TaxID=246410 RepID=UPI0000D87FD4|nr:calcium/proton exchanger [Coccidioides immitis RS]EAS29782.3 calcium/proton exchanger [Coccidioides immitis RS]